ncbi:MAG TPA: electron transfer flavoprotein subunit alpha/FixB family protein [Geobacterales bacterium]|nr:electron transfer flavoprotein subunit alpha/FixB family protein [Geobacterales bacterium]
MSENIIVFSSEPKKLIYPIGFANILKTKLNLKLTAITIESDSAEELIDKGPDELKLIRNKVIQDQFEDILRKELMGKKTRYVVSSSSYNDTDILARLAGEMNAYMFTDVHDLEIEENSIILKRKVFGGRAISKIKVPNKGVLFITVSSRRFEIELKTQTEMSYIDAIPESRVKLEKVERKVSSGVDISQAEIVIGVGRGFKNKEDIKLAEELASLIGAQIGSSRPVAADYKWIPEDRWIGISGKSIRPNLYFAIGISGAPQHIGGIQDSKIIVALDKDKNAPIFNYADYCIVADLYEFLPVLIKKIKERKTS